MGAPEPRAGLPGPRRGHGAVGAVNVRWWAALSGVLAALAGVLAGEFAAGLVSPSLSPLSAVGAAIVDFAPGAAKDWAIETFGTGDKAFLVASVTLAVVVLGAVSGILELRRPGLGVGLAALVGAAGALAVVTRSLASPGAVACALAAGIVAMSLVRWLVGRLRRDAAPAGQPLGSRTHDAGPHPPPQPRLTGRAASPGAASSGRSRARPPPSRWEAR
ncbi:hypothetical protein [Sinomonas flava]|uniref:hypothetical protein n=1 Tax=Sinomonas flava TaxID=496857 RepID=UPI0039A52C4A